MLYLPNDIPIGLIGVPFVYAAIDAVKPFVCRELLAVDSECCLLALKSATCQRANRLADTSLGTLLLKNMLTWSSYLVESNSRCKKLIDHLPLVHTLRIEDLDAPPATLLLLRKSLIGWGCSSRISHCLTHRSPFLTVSSDIKDERPLIINSENNCDEKTDIEMPSVRPTVTPELGSSIRKQLDPSGVPLSYQRLFGVSRNARIAFEQQVVLALRRYGKVFEGLLEVHHSSSTDMQLPSRFTEDLRVVIDRLKRIKTTKQMRRKKRKREISPP